MLHAQLKKHKVRPLKQISIWHKHTCMKNWPQSPSTLWGWIDCWRGARPHCPTSVPHLNNVLSGWVAANPCSRHPKPCGQHSHGTGRVLGTYIWTSSTGVNVFRAWSENGWKHTASFVFLTWWQEKRCLRPISTGPLNVIQRVRLGGGGWKRDASRCWENTRCDVKKQEMRLPLCPKRRLSTVQRSKTLW